MKSRKQMTRPAEPIEGKGIILGNEYTDSLSGLKGVATALYTFLTGCDQVNLSYVVAEKLEHLVVDVSRLVEHERAVQRPGGPAASVPPSRAVGARQ